MRKLNLPKSAFVDKFFPKSKFYENANVTSKVKQEFIDTIVKIKSLYALTEQTINISGTENIQQFHIFSIQLNSKNIPKNALKIIDKAVSNDIAILYIFEFENNFAYGITIKENAEQRYYFSDWNKQLAFDFTGNTIEHIYQKIIKLFIHTKTGLEVKKQNFEDVLAKEKQLAILEKEIVSLQKKVHTEKQFNKQVAYNKALRSKLKEKENLEKGAI
jgi:hypothetical protein